MVRKNLFLVIIKSEDANEMYLSNYVPGCFDWDEYIEQIKYVVNMAYPKNITQNLTLIKSNSKIIFSKVDNFIFNPSKHDDKLDVVDNFYIINTTDEYINIECAATIYIDKYYRENGFISCPETISCFSLIPTEKKYIEYEIKSMNYKEGLLHA